MWLFVTVERQLGSENLKVNLVPRVSHLPAPWSGRGDEGPWERGCLKVRCLVIRSLAHAQMFDHCVERPYFALADLTVCAKSDPETRWLSLPGC